ncbi:hypothetical protein [Georgenia thermotolerans]|uniref:hypothetical protein n=1 Tax=Georgenia thermotolerans TaxID=527326 RepID=UPI00126471DC|nr:hypothetical protein [Georgenia thermotolerans]
MKLRGYMCEVEWDGHTLRARGTNKAAHFGLMGPSDVDVDDYVHEGQSDRETVKGMGRAVLAVGAAQPDLVLTRDEFTVEQFKTGNALVNGKLVLRANGGKKYQLHFRRKDNSDFTALARELGAPV